MNKNLNFRGLVRKDFFQGNDLSRDLMKKYYQDIVESMC